MSKIEFDTERSAVVGRTKNILLDFEKERYDAQMKEYQAKIDEIEQIKAEYEEKIEQYKADKQAYYDADEEQRKEMKHPTYPSRPYTSRPYRPSMPRMFRPVEAQQYSFYANCPRCGSEEYVQWDHYNHNEMFYDAEGDAGTSGYHICQGELDDGSICEYEIPFSIGVNWWVEYELESVELDTEEIERNKRKFPEDYLLPRVCVKCQETFQSNDSKMKDFGEFDKDRLVVCLSCMENWKELSEWLFDKLWVLEQVILVYLFIHEPKNIVVKDIFEKLPEYVRDEDDLNLGHIEKAIEQLKEKELIEPDD